ncbi:MAG: CoA pyrophosphatase [Planctomycetota bacterium]|nr:MAG: CoA pyrophosphatase [Planctomycetota bacterium]REJ95242.1 MAG: CoA pyrophosphatase [Planctomycetota bacterium]REK27016.1 MAG: CoA pyrophosphatase [Planctomycetota bacterium]REK40315.1 MAG: CoA pyrophosphatase [Planctomycetota bacterium]
MTRDRLATRLKKILAAEPSVESAQARLAGRRRFEPELSYGRHHGPPPHTARAAAVMLLLYPRGGASARGEVPDDVGTACVWQLPLTLRPAEIASHAGQVSLPGGAVEPGETTREAALRELNEELGVAPARVETLGSLAPFYVFATNFLVTPWIGIVDEEPPWRADPREVAAQLTLPLTALAEPIAVEREIRLARGIEFGVPYLPLEGHHVWGATSMILGEFAAVLAAASIG